MGTVPLPQLVTDGYQPCTFDLRHTQHLPSGGAEPRHAAPSLEDWLKIFYDSVESFRRVAAADPAVPDAAQRAQQFAARYKADLDRVSAAAHDPDTAITCLELCRLREEALRACGFHDIFAGIKGAENAKALALLPQVCAEIDAEVDPARRWERVLRGVCAANIFDLGAAHTSALYHENGGVAFHDALDALLPRPWAVDDLDVAVARLAGGPPHLKAVLFVDNAGGDLVLGMLPLARELLRAGAAVTLAANELPAINDITASELEQLLAPVAAADERLCKAVSTGALRVVSSGSGLPVVDLAAVSAELAEACKGADLVVLEGMGRSIETNLCASFTCDALKLGMVKHPEVAAALRGRMMDCVVKFDAARAVGP